MHFISSSVNETRAFGAKVASVSRCGDIYVLEGDLGVGKTEFVRGFVNSIDGSIVVRSPSFSIVNTYITSRLEIHHFDFYRLSDASELDEIGFEEYTAGDGICLIEWGSRFPWVIPQKSRLIVFRDAGVYKREIEYDFGFEEETGKLF